MKFALTCTIAILSSLSLMAFPKYLERFTKDPLSSPQFQNRCATCHIDPKGGSPRNEFGQAFEANDFTITPDLRARFQERFQYPVQIIDSHTEIHYSDPTNKTVVLKRDGTVTVIDPANPPKAAAPAGGVARAQPAGETGGPKPAVPAAGQSGRISEWEKPRQISNRWINLPQPIPVRRNDMNFLVQHRFSAPLFNGSAGRLFGLDSTANIAFGFDYGVWNRVMASVYRARSDRTIEMDITGDIFHQQRGDPISLAAKIGIEGQNNFRGIYSPHVQVMAARELGRYVDVMVAPTVIFNSQNNGLFFLRDFATNPDDDYTVNLGVGLSVKVRPSLAIVGEYIPRLAGFRGYFVDRPALSVALQKQTFHHVFSLVISTSTQMSPGRYGPNVGSDTDNRFKIGFNIFRKLR
ncbi:MAG TPA: DUF5777 family beta-barrel protein [Acidobacteriota bacterium]|jgi:hypothetical protein